MDMISHILETDKLAQDRIDDAQARRVEILQGAEAEIVRMKNDANAEIEEYRVKKEAEVRKKTDAEVLKINTAQQVKIHELDKLYEDNHEEWEKEILEGILAQ